MLCSICISCVLSGAFHLEVIAADLGERPLETACGSWGSSLDPTSSLVGDLCWQRERWQEAAYGQGYALQTLAHTFCAELSPDEGLSLGRAGAEHGRGAHKKEPPEQATKKAVPLLDEAYQKFEANFLHS